MQTRLAGYKVMNRWPRKGQDRSLEHSSVISTALQQHEKAAQQDFLPFSGTDYVEFYVGNARQAAYFYRLAMGMRWIAYAGPETGVPDRASFVLEQGDVRFVLTTPIRPDNEVAEHVHLHGDGVRDVALRVEDARSAWRHATRRGARSVREPFEVSDLNGPVKLASIATYGDTIHTFVERRDYRGAFLPGYEPVARDPLARPTGLTAIDHIAGNVGQNEINRWADFYASVLGFRIDKQFDGDGAASECTTACISKPAARGNGLLRFTLASPSSASRKPGIREYLEYHHGPGVQHVALATTDIIYTVSKMQEQGVEFLQMPHSYYSGLQERTPQLDELGPGLEKRGILVERDEEGYLLQSFTRPVEDRPTLFFEIIERKGGRTFRQARLKTA